jgi:hypothetical protein
LAGIGFRLKVCILVNLLPIRRYIGTEILKQIKEKKGKATYGRKHCYCPRVRLSQATIKNIGKKKKISRAFPPTVKAGGLSRRSFVNLLDYVFGALPVVNNLHRGSVFTSILQYADR